MANLKFKRYKTTTALNDDKSNFAIGDIVFDAQAKIIYIVTAKSDNSATLEPYYGINSVASVSGSSNTITATKADGTSNTITINNVANAGMAGSAETASKLGTNAGSKTKPVYFSEGVPVVVDNLISNDISGTAAYATNLGDSENAYNYGDLHRALAVLTAADGNLSSRLDNSELVNGNKFASLESIINDLNDWAANPTVNQINTNILNVAESINIGGTILDKTEYSGNAKTATSATSASKLAVDAGSTEMPIYFKNGIPVAITDLKLKGDSTNAAKVGTSRVISGSEYAFGYHVQSAGNCIFFYKSHGWNENDDAWLKFDGSGFRVAYSGTKGTMLTTKTESSRTFTLLDSGNWSSYVGIIKDNPVQYANEAVKTQKSLTFGSKSFNGSEAKEITAADLGLSSALKFLGTTTTALTDGATANPITINSANITAQIGNVVLYNHLEFIWNGSKWEELGDEQSFALKSIQIKAGNGLTGGGTLEETRTISHYTPSSVATNLTVSGRRYITGLTFDDFGHVTGYSTGTESDQTDISGNAATVTDGVYTNMAQTITGQKNFNTNSNSVPVLISRVGSTYETLKIGVDDSTAYFEHIQDETISNFRFIGTWTDTASGGGANAGSAYVQFNLSSTNVGIDLNGKTVYHSGNLTKLSQLSDDLGATPAHSHSQYALKAGDTITGAYTFNNKVTFNDSVSITDLTASSLIVNGSTRFNNAVIASTFTGNLEGNAKTATSATSASSVPWSGVTSKPTTLSGYGITDGVPTYTVSSTQTTLGWIKSIAQKKASRMSFYYNTNGAEWAYLLGCRNSDADSSLGYGSILKFGYSDTYLRILRIQGGTWKSTDWEKISAGYADTSGACSGNSATATTATSTSGLICSDVRGADRSPDTYFTAKRVSALFNNSITGANSVWNSAIHVHGWTSGYVAWELIGPASDSIGSDNLYWREGINSTWQPVRKILDSSNYNNYAPTLTGTGATGTWGINISGNASTSSACSGNSSTATKLATSRTLWGQSFNGSGNVDGTIRITPTTNNYTEGIRIKPYSGNGWTTILLGGTDLSADTGTSTNSWSLHTHAGNFYLNRNNSSVTTPYLLCNVSGNWGMGTNAPAYKLDVQGTLRATGATTFSSSLSVTGDIAASSNVNVTNQTKSKTFNIDGGCTLEYDSTNKCVKFVF